MGEPRLLTGRKYAPEHLGHVLVLGLGKSGRATATYLARLLGTRVDALTVAAGTSKVDERSLPDVPEGRDGVRIVTDREWPEGSFDLCVASPGIPQGSAFYQSAAAASAEIIGEVEFAWRESATSARWIAVTGTNGKTTVTTLVAHLLACDGANVRAVGNIGDTCIEAVAADDADVYVAETSSYQLASTVRFAPDIAVLLNITPDHLHWHGTFEAYRSAKLNILANMKRASDGVAILDATDDEVRAEVRRLRRSDDGERGFSYVPIGTAQGLSGDMRKACGSENAAFVDGDGVLRVAFRGVEHRLARADELLVKGLHNVDNALAAAAAALASGANAESVIRGLQTFPPLEHRIEPCGTVRGARCYNDSKATNVDATLKALASFPEARPIVLLGGDDKGTDLTELVETTHEHARACVCFGDAGPRFADAFERAASAAPEGFHLLRAGRLEDALDAALSIVRAGDVVLLSPACASFDEFGSFEERGRAFKDLVAARSAVLGG